MKWPCFTPKLYPYFSSDWGGGLQVSLSMCRLSLQFHKIIIVHSPTCRFKKQVQGRWDASLAASCPPSVETLIKLLQQSLKFWGKYMLSKDKIIIHINYAGGGLEGWSQNPRKKHILLLFERGMNTIPRNKCGEIIPLYFQVGICYFDIRKEMYLMPSALPPASTFCAHLTIWLFSSGWCMKMAKYVNIREISCKALQVAS